MAMHQSESRRTYDGKEGGEKVMHFLYLSNAEFVGDDMGYDDPTHRYWKYWSSCFFQLIEKFVEKLAATLMEARAQH